MLLSDSLYRLLYLIRSVVSVFLDNKCSHINIVVCDPYHTAKGCVLVALARGRLCGARDDWRERATSR